MFRLGELYHSDSLYKHILAKRTYLSCQYVHLITVSPSLSFMSDICTYQLTEPVMPQSHIIYFHFKHFCDIEFTQKKDFKQFCPHSCARAKFESMDELLWEGASSAGEVCVAGN